MNLFLDGDDNGDQPQLRDNLTEGYNPIPNFFISARIPNKRDGEDKFLSFDDKELRSQERGIQLNRQFENRLFDRDTLLLCHYDVNFLYIVSLYGRSNKNAQAIWREYVRKEFRRKIQETLNRLYSFRTLQPRKGMDCYQFIQNNFQQLNGKLYRPKANCNYLVLAMIKNDEPEVWKSLNVKVETVEGEVTKNNELLNSLQSYFYVSNPFKLGTNFHIDNVEDVGTLDRQSKEKKNILTGLVRTTDSDFEMFAKHTSKTYTMETIPTTINIMDIEYFLPIVDECIDGYYKVDKVFFDMKDNKLCLKLNLSSYVSLNDKWLQIKNVKMQSGELISYGFMMKLYE